MWIKPASDVSFRVRRRAASVPADVGTRTSRYDIGSGVGTNKAHVIAHHAHEDTDAIAAASKRNDREFLYEVSAKMANLATNTNLPPRSSLARNASPSVRRRPPPPSFTSAPVSSYLRHAASLTPEDNYDIDAYLQRAPSSTTSLGSYRQSTGRATSLPPISVHRTLQVPHPSAPRWYPSSVAYYGRSATGRPVTSGRTGGPISFPVGLPPRPPTGDRLDAITDSVVGVARTSLYGDIVIGIPYKKHYMFNVQREFDDLDTQSLPAVQYRANNAPHFANTRPASLALPNGAPELARPYSRASYAGPSTVGFDNRPLVHGVNGGLYPSSAADLDDAVSIKSYPGAFVRHRSAARTSRRPLTALNGYGSHVGDYENDLDGLDFDDSGAVSQLSSLKRDAKSILSRYSMSPSTSTRNGPKHMTADELDHKYGQIVSGMQARNRIQPRSDYATASLPPYPSPPKKPEMSDTRRKLRELLCRSRNDPHYFDS